MNLVVARLGAIGIGLLWGSLLAQFSGRSVSTSSTLLTLATATIVIGIEVVLFSDWRGSVFFIGAVAVALLLQRWWYRELEQHLHSFT